MSEIWMREPLEYHGTIPVFSVPDEYISNYETISADHLEAVEQDNINPFIPEELWVQIEESTRLLIRKYARPRDKVLDVGVGLGRLLGPLTDLERHGIDISYGYLEIAQAAGIEVCFSKIGDMPYRPGVFDIVVCTDVLEHVFDLNSSLAEILKVLKAGGILITRTPYREDLSWYLSPECPYRFAHLRTFDEHGLHLLLDRVFGCTLLERSFTGYIDLSRRIKYTLPLPAGSVVLNQFVRAIKRIHRPTYVRLLEKLYLPMEICHVFRKL